jgi:hypothetical protein
VWQALIPLAVSLSLVFNLLVQAELAYLGPRGRQADRLLYGATELVRIGDEYYRPEILAAAAGYRRALEAIGADGTRRLEAAVDSIFDRYEANVDAYLDWYYSLPAEYARLGAVLSGDVSGFLSDALAAELARGADLSPISDIYRDVSRQAAKFSADRLKARFRYDPPPGSEIIGRVSVARTLAGAGFFARIEPPSLTSLKTRLTVSAGAGVAGGLAAGLAARRVAARIAASAFQRLAARQLVKAAAARGSSRLAAAAAGGAAGAAASAATGPGMAAGVAAGVLVGLATSFAADAAILKLEEVVYRASYRASIIGVIEEARLEIKGQLSGGSPPAPAAGGGPPAPPAAGDAP